MKKTAVFFVFLCGLIFLCGFQSPGFTDTLSETSTPLMNKLEGRTSNIILACKKINGAVIPPGGTFSFNGAVGKRTRGRGFKPAPSFVNGQIGQSVGGGICQNSSTLYYACLLADLEIIERVSHSMYPDYFEQVGLDATVDWNEGIDFKFKNNTKSPVKISTWLAEGRVYVRLTGTKSGLNTVEIKTNVIAKTAAKTIYRDSGNMSVGEERVIRPAFNGYTVETYRRITDENGTEVKRVFEARSEYKKLDGIIERGAKKPAA